MLQNLINIAPLEWERDDDNAGGYVAEVAAEKLADLKNKFRAAGYETSISADESGVNFLWVMGGPEAKS
jgi:hypothetical protein